MEKTQRIVNNHLEKAKEKQKKHYDKKAKAVAVQVGDLVLVKILAHEGKHKIENKFEEELYRLIAQPREEIPVFELEGKTSGRKRTLHRNHLYLVNQLVGKMTLRKRLKRPPLQKRTV